MPYTYRPRGMPRRFLEGAPDTVRAQVLDLVRITPAAPLDFDVLFQPSPFPRSAVIGLDFGANGARGCHFELTTPQARAYRDRNRRKRVAWRDLPEPTQRALVAYLGTDE